MTSPNNQLLQIRSPICFWSVLIIEVYCLFSAIYIAIIGGTGFYFFAAVLLLMQWLITLRSKKLKLFFSILCFCLLLISGLTSIGSTFFTQLSVLMLIPSVVLILLNLKSIQNTIKPKILISIILIFSFFIAAFTQHLALTHLKAHNSTFKTGETWQQMGAL